MPLPICYTLGFLLHSCIPAFLHLFPYACLIRVHSLCVRSISCVSLYAVPCVPPNATPCVPLGFLVGSLLRSLCTVGPPYVFSRSLHREFIVRIVFFMRSPCVPRAFPRVFGSLFLKFSNGFINGSRWVRAIFAVHSSFVTPRVSFALNGFPVGSLRH